MTIIVAIKAKDGIAIVSDSQTTMPNGQKFLNAKKIHAIQFANSVAAVAEGGACLYSRRAIETMSEMAANKSISDYRTVADVAQDAIRKVYEDLVRPNFKGSSDEAFADYISRNCYFSLTIANYFNDKPYLFTIGSNTGIANLETDTGIAIGESTDLARYILNECTDSTVNRQTALASGIFVVERVKEFSAYCGGEAQAMLLCPASSIFPGIPTTKDTLWMPIDFDLIHKYVSALSDHYFTAKLNRQMEMARIFLKVTEMRHKELDEAMREMLAEEEKITGEQSREIPAKPQN